jgi:hypothetical protein
VRQCSEPANQSNHCRVARKRQRTGALQDASRRSQAAVNASRLGLRWPSTAFARAKHDFHLVWGSAAFFGEKAVKILPFVKIFPPFVISIQPVAKFDHLFVKLKVLFVNLRSLFVVLEALFVNLMMPFVILDRSFVVLMMPFVILDRSFVVLMMPFVNLRVVFVIMVLSEVKFLFVRRVRQNLPLPLHTGCCCVRQCNEPKPQTRSTA